MYQRQAASCIPAMGSKLEETVLNSRIEVDPDEAVELAATEDGVHGDGAVVELDLDERDLVARLQQTWLETRHVDTKFDEFAEELVRMLEQGIEKVIVFSFFRRTIDYLGRRLSELTVAGNPLKVFKLYGPIDPSERPEVVRTFRDSAEPSVMLSSEVGSEGLDFQFCSVMFNYDLPWNPMRVEQRIGRLDRYGQQAERIEIRNLVVKDTIEDRIFYRLYDRIGIFERSIGDLEEILGDPDVDEGFRTLQRDVIAGRLTPDEEEERGNLIADAIIRRQQEHDEFDEQSKQFLGGDDVLRERFNNIEEGQRFITADELRNFLERFFARTLPGVRFRAIADPRGTFLLADRNRELGRFLADWFGRDPTTSKLDWQLLARLDGSGVPVTFDARVAALDHDVEFVSIHHPLVRAVRMASEESGELVATGRLQVQGDGVPSGPRFSFVFEIGVTGIQRQVEFVPVAVTPQADVDAGLTENLLAKLTNATPSSADPTGIVTVTAVDQAVAAARSWIAAETRRREEEAREVNDATVDAQVSSLQLHHERQRGRIEQRLAGIDDERIIRLYQGQLRNSEIAFDQKVRELESRRGVDASHRLVAAALVEVV